jgi:hypothetical protein
MVSLKTIVPLKRKTRSYRPRSKSARHWRLVSDLRRLHKTSFSHLAKTLGEDFLHAAPCVSIVSPPGTILRVGRLPEWPCGPLCVSTRRPLCDQAGCVASARRGIGSSDANNNFARARMRPRPRRLRMERGNDTACKPYAGGGTAEGSAPSLRPFAKNETVW